MLKNGTHRPLPERKCSRMAHIGVHCTLHKIAMLKNGTYLCKLQLHVDVGSIIHFCTDTNTQNRTNFTKSINTRFITDMQKLQPSSFSRSYELFITMYHGRLQSCCSCTIVLQNLTNKATSMLRMILCTKHQCFKFTVWETFVWKMVVFTEKKELELLLLHHSIAKFDQQSNFQIEDDIMHKTSVFQVYDLRNFCSEDW